MMKNTVFLSVALVLLTLVALAQQSAKPLYRLEESYLRWRLQPSEQSYGETDGKHLKHPAVESTAGKANFRILPAASGSSLWNVDESFGSWR